MPVHDFRVILHLFQQRAVDVIGIQFEGNTAPEFQYLKRGGQLNRSI